MVKKIGLMITTVFMIVFLSACESNDNEYDEIIDQVFEEVQKFNDDEDYLYVHSGREESDIYIYKLDGHEDEGLVIRVYYPYEEKKTGVQSYGESWYIYDNSIKKIEVTNMQKVNVKNLELISKIVNINQP